MISWVYTARLDLMFTMLYNLKGIIIIKSVMRSFLMCTFIFISLKLCQDLFLRHCQDMMNHLPQHLLLSHYHPLWIAHRLMLYFFSSSNISILRFFHIMIKATLLGQRGREPERAQIARHKKGKTSQQQHWLFTAGPHLAVVTFDSLTSADCKWRKSISLNSIQCLSSSEPSDKNTSYKLKE